MRFDATLVGLVLSVIGTLVVVAGAIVAVRQLRYIRHGNELATLTEFQKAFDATDMVEACAFVRNELPAAMKDPAFVDDLRTARTTAGARSVLEVANFFEEIGVFLHYGALSKDMTYTIWGVVAGRYWSLMRDAVEIFREERMVLRFFEDLAVRSDRWLLSDTFRARLGRLAKDDGRTRATIVE